jgi:DNA-directed RNA polymerase specialized sigma24 family protein
MGPDAERLRRAAAGDRHAWSEPFAEHRSRLRRMIALRLDRRLQGWIDPSDVIQETFIDAMDPLDRDVLVLRHFEELTNVEAAQTLGIQESAASKRYVRALGKLKEVLRSMPGGSGEFHS